MLSRAWRGLARCPSPRAIAGLQGILHFPTSGILPLESYCCLLKTQELSLERRARHLARPGWVIQKPRRCVGLADGGMRCCACAGQRYTYEPARAASQKLQRRAKNGQQQRSGRTVRRLELRSRVRSSVGSSFCKARLDWRSTSLCRGLGFRSRVRVCGGVFVSFSHSETRLVLGGITAVYFSIEYTPTPSQRNASHSRGTVVLENTISAKTVTFGGRRRARPARPACRREASPPASASEAGKTGPLEGGTRGRG